jgi:peptide-methionine (R)-S-oxide reductase
MMEMMSKKVGLSLLLACFVAQSCAQKNMHSEKTQEEKTAYNYKIQKTDEEWKADLSEDEYKVLREKGTERAFTGKYNDFKKEGLFLCAACKTPVFSSETKYESGSGWPSFYTPYNKENIREIPDNSFGMTRTEIVCASCGGHLGHVFEDGPEPTGLRYCINSVALDFKEQ